MNVLDFLFPKRCVGCGKIGSYFCGRCAATIRLIGENECICPMCGRAALDGKTHPFCKTRYGLDGLTTFFHYEHAVQKAIKAIKYRFVFDLARDLMRFAPLNKLPVGVVVPVPLHPARFRYRGFNQAETLGALLPGPIKPAILRRVKYTNPQAEMNKIARLENMKHVFVAEKTTERILLFDDVFTTGATMRAAAYALKRAGAPFVWAVTVAR